MKNVAQLRDALSKVFDDLEKEKISPEKAGQLVNCAGKIISTVKVEIDYARMWEQQASIKFMEQK